MKTASVVATFPYVPPVKHYEVQWLNNGKGFLSYDLVREEDGTPYIFASIDTAIQEARIWGQQHRKEVRIVEVRDDEEGENKK
jgi:hypothetical protein